jgi:hypothetical protein
MCWERGPVDVATPSDGRTEEEANGDGTAEEEVKEEEDDESGDPQNIYFKQKRII